jgi:hypothetical protein
MNRDIEMGDILNAIGQQISLILDRYPDGAFLYAEAEAGSRSASVFVEENGKAVCYAPTKVLFNEIRKLWDAAEVGKKWSALEFDVEDGKFNANFTFPEQIDPTEEESDRRDRKLFERFGDKPILYPSLGPNTVELTLDDLAHLDDSEG